MSISSQSLSITQTGGATVEEGDSARRAAFVQRLAQWRGKEVRLSLATLLEVFSIEFPHRPRENELRYWLLEAILEAQQLNIISLPSNKKKGWDHTQLPALPRYVNRIIIGEQARAKSWKVFPWHTKLQWIKELGQLSVADEEFLRNVHKGLINNSFDQIATLKHRSWELTGDEKRLSMLRNSVLFSENRLTLELLGCVPTYPPLKWETIDSRRNDLPPAILVFENPDLLWVATQVMSKITSPPYGMVAVGYGYEFVASLQHLTRFPKQIECVDYVGDIDRPGMHIALLAQLKMQELGLPPLTPAPGIHQAMLDVSAARGAPLGIRHKADGRQNITLTDEELVDWLPDCVQAQIKQVLSAGNRIAEEALSYQNLYTLWQ